MSHLQPPLFTLIFVRVVLVASKIFVYHWFYDVDTHVLSFKTAEGRYGCVYLSEGTVLSRPHLRLTPYVGRTRAREGVRP